MLVGKVCACVYILMLETRCEIIPQRAIIGRKIKCETNDDFCCLNIASI